MLGSCNTMECNIISFLQKRPPSRKLSADAATEDVGGDGRRESDAALLQSSSAATTIASTGFLTLASAAEKIMIERSSRWFGVRALHAAS